MLYNYRVTTTLSDESIKSPEAKKLYLRYAGAVTEHRRMPNEIRMLEDAANSRRRMIQENLKNGLYHSYINDQMRRLDEKALEELQKHIKSYQELKDDWARRMDQCRQEMAEKHVPWFDRAVNVMVRNIDSHVDHNPYIEVSRSVEKGRSAKAKSDDLVAEVQKDLEKYLDPRDFKLVPSHEEQQLHIMGVAPAMVGAVVVFSSAIEDDVKMAMANVVRDRVMSHPDIQGTGKESFDQLRATVQEIGLKEAISLMEYEFIDRYGKFENSIADLVLHGDGEMTDRLKGFEVYEQATFLLPEALRKRKDVEVLLAERDRGMGPTTEEDKRIQIKLLQKFSESFDQRIHPTAGPDIGLG